MLTESLLSMFTVRSALLSELLEQKIMAGGLFSVRAWLLIHSERDFSFNAASLFFRNGTIVLS